MNMLFIILFLGFCCYALFNIFAHSNHHKESNELFNAGRSLTLSQVILTLLGIQIGGGVIVGTAEISYNNGLYGIMYTLGLAIGLVVMSFFAAGKLREMKINTVAEIFEKTYGSKYLRKMVSLLSIIALFGVLVGQILASKKLFLSMGFSNISIFIIAWILIIFYVAFGGMKVIAKVSRFQVFTIGAVFVSIFAMIVAKYNVIEIVANAENTLPDDMRYSAILVPFLFCFIEQDMAQVLFSSKSAKIAKLGALFAGIGLFIFSIIPVLIGVIAKDQAIISNGSILSSFIGLYSPEYVSALANFAILMAVISTADSILCSIGSNITFDFLKNRLGQYITIFIGLCGLFATFYANDIVKLFLESYRILICTTFLPILAAYFRTDMPYTFPLVCMIAGIAIYIFAEQYCEIFAIMFQLPILAFYLLRNKCCING